MAKYYSSTLQKGSKGDEVKEWQNFLISQGYNLSADGIFGGKTYAATLAFQMDNGLTGDGIVGKDTWGKAGYTPFSATSSSATSSSTASTPTAAPTAKPLPNSPTYDTTSWDDTEKGQAALGDYNAAKDKVNNYGDFTYEDYKESDEVKGASDALNAHLANKPGEYQSQWQSQLDALMNSIMNREKFSYDVNEDALYQQYKDKYVQQGKLAMGDTMGQAAAMTGGYGNSYAQSVGQQAYQASLDNLNDIVPELYAMALDQYEREGQELYNQYGMVMDRENLDYGRYRDTVADWQTDRGYLTDRYDSERNFDYGKYVDDRNLDYSLHQEGYQRLIDSLGIAQSDYYDGANMFQSEQTNKNNVAGQQFNDAMSIWSAETEQAWKQAQWEEAARQYADDQAWKEKEYELAEKEYNAKYGLSGDNGDNSGNDGNDGNDGGNYDNGGLTDAQVKELQKALGVTADGAYGPNSKAAAGGLSADEAYKKFVGNGPQETADTYADWDAGDWEGYFATIRNNESKSAAEEELNRMVAAGLIPKNMISYAAIGARGSLGH